MTRILRSWKTTLILLAVLALALALPKCEGKGSHPFTQRASVTPVHSCTMAYGQCEVTQFIHHRPNGTAWEETCVAEPPVKPGASDVWIAVDNCYRP